MEDDEGVLEHVLGIIPRAAVGPHQALHLAEVGVQPVEGRLVAAFLLAVSVAGKLAGVHLAGRILKWAPGEASLVGWLLQTKALIMIIFVNVLLDKTIITNAMFTALLLMAVGSTMLTIPIVAPKLQRMRMTVSRIA